MKAEDMMVFNIKLHEDARNMMVFNIKSTCPLLRIRDLHQYLEKMLPEITYNIGAQHMIGRYLLEFKI